MSTAYAAGKRREYAVRDHMIFMGWTHVMTAAGSKGPADLILAHPIHGLALVQVGTSGKFLGPQARKDLIALADLCSALPIVATPIPRHGIRYRVVTFTPAQSWPVFDPAHGLDPRR